MRATVPNPTGVRFVNVRMTLNGMAVCSVRFAI